ncbi:LolA family protein [Paraburkholderia sp. GAS42]|jgi:outer membrane lipoprotein-sorting protein|uniref:LolA family protein n=1 Tax=Paraburkholderia sp. GAS42 TaxID=3035135 RepID=UPI003D1932FD
MKRIVLWMLVGCLTAAVYASEQIPAGHDLSVDQIVEKNADARGGLDAWRKIETMVWVGHVDSANAPEQELPFVLALKRPNKTRFEITVLNRRAVRVFDGKQGWKVSPSVMGSGEVRAYTPDELKSAHDEQVIDGLLIDHQAKGVDVALDGIEKVDGHDAYRLGVKLPSGVIRHVWVDAQSFLDVKVDRQARGPHGPVTVEVTYGDYRSVNGLQIPFAIESGAAASGKHDKLTLDKVTLNPPLDDMMFTRPPSQGHRNSASVNAEVSPPALPAMNRPSP